MGIKPALLALNCCLQKLFHKHAVEHPQDVALMRAFDDASYVNDIPIFVNGDNKQWATYSLQNKLLQGGS